MRSRRLISLTLVLAFIGSLISVFLVLAPQATAGPPGADNDSGAFVSGPQAPNQQGTPGTPTTPAVTPTPITSVPPDTGDKVPIPILLAVAVLAFAAGVAVGYYIWGRPRQQPPPANPGRRGAPPRR